MKKKMLCTKFCQAHVMTWRHVIPEISLCAYPLRVWIKPVRKYIFHSNTQSESYKYMKIFLQKWKDFLFALEYFSRFVERRINLTQPHESNFFFPAWKRCTMHDSYVLKLQQISYFLWKSILTSSILLVILDTTLKLRFSLNGKICMFHLLCLINTAACLF